MCCWAEITQIDGSRSLAFDHDGLMRLSMSSSDQRTDSRQNISVTVDESAECNELQEINFCDGINGNGSVFLYNNVVIDYRSVQDFERIDTSVLVVPQEIFQRGDCNSDDKVDLADVATGIGSQFSGLPILCSDACDSNDDGLINLADSVFVLNWLFKFGDAPADPGPINDGPDPSADLLPICVSDDSGCVTQP